jgi:hypothetical protein
MTKFEEWWLNHENEINTQPWIPVSERLPTEQDGIEYGEIGIKESGVIVRVLYKNGTQSTAIFLLKTKKFRYDDNVVAWKPES